MFNLNEAIINHRDLGDLMLDILKEREEQRDNPYAFGVGVLCKINEFVNKVEDEHEPEDKPDPYFESNEADFRRKM